MDKVAQEAQEKGIEVPTILNDLDEKTGRFYSIEVGSCLRNCCVYCFRHTEAVQHPRECWRRRSTNRTGANGAKTGDNKNLTLPSLKFYGPKLFVLDNARRSCRCTHHHHAWSWMSNGCSWNVSASDDSLQGSCMKCSRNPHIDSWWFQFWPNRADHGDGSCQLLLANRGGEERESRRSSNRRRRRSPRRDTNHCCGDGWCWSCDGGFHLAGWFLLCAWQ